MDNQTQRDGVNFGESNEIQINGDVFGGDKILGDKITIGAVGSINVQYYRIKLRAPLREIFDPLIEDRTKLFGGRDVALDKIAKFIQSPEGGYLVITTKAGFGKTALLADLVSRTPTAFAYHFFTSLYDHSPDSLDRDKATVQPVDHRLPDSLLSEFFFLRNVIEQMAQWHGHQGLLPGRLDELRALYHKLIDQPLKHTQILVLDGLDEVTHWKLDFYLCRRLPPNLHIIVTVRDGGQNWQTEYKFPDNQWSHLSLDGFNRDEVEQVMHAAGGDAVALAKDPNLLKEIMKKAVYDGNIQLGADPFYVRLLAEDAAKGLLTAANITQQPQGLDNYLKHWLETVIKITKTSKDHREAIVDLIGTLIVAQGSISRIDLEVINPRLAASDKLYRIFPQVIQQVRRFVIGEDDVGYKLMHPRLSKHMRESSDIDVDTYIERVLAYCKRWPEHESAYALAYYPQHLVDAGQHETLYALIDKPWMDLKFKRTFSHHSFAKDVALAIEMAAADKTARGLIQLVRNCLIYATLTQVTSQVSPELLGPSAQTGQADKALAKALADAALRGDPEAYLAIARARLEKDDWNKDDLAAAKAALEQALQAAKGLGDKEKQTHALCQVAKVWTQLKEPAQATVVISCAQRVVQEIQNRDVRGRAMCAVVINRFVAPIGATNP